MSAGDTSVMPSRWSRMRATPLRDLLRLRVTGRLSIEQRMAAYALPPSLAGVVRDVTRRTRLWRLEKADVAEELAAHFADGLAQGRSADELAATFGEAAKAAKLIRRAKRRNRPWPWHAARWTGFAVLGIVGVYLLLGVRFWLGRPAPHVDYAAKLGATAAAVPEADRAWPIYRQGFLALEDPADVVRAFNRPPFPGEDGWDELAAYLARNAEAIDVIRTAAAKPGLGYVPDFGIHEEDRALWPDRIEPAPTPPGDKILIGIYVPYLAELRKAARILAWDTQRAAAAGAGDEVLANLIAMIDVAEHSRETPFVVSDLVAYAILAQACHTVRDVLTHAPDVLADEQLVVLAHRLSRTNHILTVRLEGEQLMYDDFVQHVYTDDGHGNGRLTREGLRVLQQLSMTTPSKGEDAALLAAMPAVDLVMLDRKDMTLAYREVFAQFERDSRVPLWKQGPSTAEDQLETWKGSLVDSIRYFPIVMLMPALGKIVINCEIAILERDVTQVAIALELYRREHGDWPVALAAIPTTLLPSVPPDRFDGRPLRYRVREDGSPVLYSVGTDRDDDGGVAPPGYSLKSQARRWIPAEDLATAQGVPDGDWVLWPGQRGHLFKDD